MLLDRPSHRTPGQNLRMIIDRYTQMSGPTPDSPFGPRQGRLYPELTSRGLVAVSADIELPRVALAHVVVIGASSISTAVHSINRDTGNVDRRTEYATLDLSQAPGKTVFDLSEEELDALSHEDQPRIASTVFNALSRIAEMGSAYDALHQTHARRYPVAPQGQDRMYPNAGLPYGPRINLEAMLRSDDNKFHSAVLEAALNMPPLRIED